MFVNACCDFIVLWACACLLIAVYARVIFCVAVFDLSPPIFVSSKTSNAFSCLLFKSDCKRLTYRSKSVAMSIFLCNEPFEKMDVLRDVRVKQMLWWIDRDQN